MPLNPFSDSDFALRRPSPYGPPDPLDPFADYGGEEDEGDEGVPGLEEFGTDVGPGIGYGNLGVTDLSALYDSVVATNQGYRNRGLQIPTPQLSAEKFLLGQLSTQKRWEAGQARAEEKVGRDLALDLKKIADTNARSAASIGAANARNAASIAAQMDRALLSQEGQNLRTQYTQEQQTRREEMQQYGESERQEKLLAFNREKLGAETEQNAIANKLQELQLGISAGRLNLDTALGVLEKWLQAYPSSLPEGAQYTPGFQPGGGVEAGARLAGLSYNPEQYRARPVPFNPAAVVQQTMRGG